MTRPKVPIAVQLEAARLSIDNTLADEEIAALVAALGYDETRLRAGRGLFQAARAAVSARAGALGAQLRANTQFLAAKARAVDAYQALAKVARAVCPPADLARLGLAGRMPHSTAGFLTAAGTLVDNAAQLESLADYGYGAAGLAAARAAIEAYAAAERRHEAAKGATQQATVDQDAALRALNRWAARYKKIARVALRAKPQLLEKLGIITPAARPHARQPAPTPQAV